MTKAWRTEEVVSPTDQTVPNSTFYPILSGFHRIFATGVACRQGTLTPPDT